MTVCALAIHHHCEPPGLAFGKPEDRLREAIQEGIALDILLDCFVAALLAMTASVRSPT